MSDWDEFQEGFLEHFLPLSMRKAKARDFELRQTPGMSVIVYDIRFIRLSRNVPHLHLLERDLIRRFVRGLVCPLFRVLTSQINHFSSYSDAVDLCTCDRDEGDGREWCLEEKIRVEEEGSLAHGRPKGGRVQPVRAQSLPKVSVAPNNLLQLLRDLN